MKYVLIVLMINSLLNAASFDCNHATTIIEKNICSNEELSQLDSKMDILYKSFTSDLNNDKKEFIKSQMHWLKNVRNKDNSVEGLLSSYKARVTFLELNLRRISWGFSILTKHDYEMERFVVISKEPNERLNSFNKSIREIGNENSEVLDCDTLVLVSVGTVHGNNSYGGFCSVKRNKKISSVMICDDDMIGHFKIVDQNSSSLYELGEFTYKNCFGG